MKSEPNLTFDYSFISFEAGLGLGLRPGLAVRVGLGLRVSTSG